MHQWCCRNKSQVMVFSLWTGLAGSGGRADAHPGADGEERQHERTAGQRQRLTEQLPAPCQSPTARDSAEGQGLHWGGLRQGDYLNIYVFCQAPVQKIKTITVLIQTLCVTSHTFWRLNLKSALPVKNVLKWNCCKFIIHNVIWTHRVQVYKE